MFEGKKLADRSNELTIRFHLTCWISLRVRMYNCTPIACDKRHDDTCDVFIELRRTANGKVCHVFRNVKNRLQKYR